MGAVRRASSVIIVSNLGAQPVFSNVANRGRRSFSIVRRLTALDCQNPRSAMQARLALPRSPMGIPGLRGVPGHGRPSRGMRPHFPV